MPSILVYNPHGLAKSRRRRIQPLSFSFRSRARRLKLYAVTNHQPRRWSNECPSRSALSRLASRISHTHTHSLSLVIFPAGGRAINNCQSASPIFTPLSFLPLSNSRADVPVCDKQVTEIITPPHVTVFTTVATDRHGADAKQGF